MSEVVWSLAALDRDATVTSQFMSLHGIQTYGDLVERSIAEPDWFWDAVVRFLGLPFQRPYATVQDTSAGVAWTKWFADGAINVSEVCLDRWMTERADRAALVVESEDGSTVELSVAALLAEVERAAAALQALGIVEGDRVATYLPMSAEAIVTLLATARIGAMCVPIFSGFGAPAVAARIVDAGARVLVCAASYERRGRPVAMKAVADEAADRAGIVTHVVVVGAGELTHARDRSWESLLRAIDPATSTPATDTPSETPFLLAYTSGTTGRPKGVVHVHGGFTVKVASEGAFQTDFRPGDRVSWITDMGWIMGPWVTIAALANGATLVLYDGAPDHPAPDRIWSFASRHRLTFLGIPPTLVRSLRSSAPDGHREADLSSLRAFGSTGEPWNEDPWWWLFRDVGGSRLPIVNLSGGTEVGASLLSVNLLQGVKPLSLGGPALGLDVDVVDDRGRSLPAGAVGELVCRAPWPGMTRGVWGDPERYMSSYWNRFPGVWVHGDWASRDEDGFWYLHGRSDDTLNVAGKRVGPAELESIAVSVPGVSAAAVVGMPDPVKGEAIAICVTVQGGGDGGRVEAITAAVSEAIVTQLGKAYRPSVIHVVEDLPRTRSGKIVRRAVRGALLGEDVGDVSTLENPECLQTFPSTG